MTLWERHLADRVQQLESALVRARHERDRQRARAEKWRTRALETTHKPIAATPLPRHYPRVRKTG